MKSAPKKAKGCSIGGQLGTVVGCTDEQGGLPKPHETRSPKLVGCVSKATSKMPKRPEQRADASRQPRRLLRSLGREGREGWPPGSSGGASSFVLLMRCYPRWDSALREKSLVHRTASPGILSPADFPSEELSHRWYYWAVAGHYTLLAPLGKVLPVCLTGKESSVRRGSMPCGVCRCLEPNLTCDGGPCHVKCNERESIPC
jgi:hypothetical protein